MSNVVNSPNLREEHTLKLFESKALKRIFALKKEEIIGRRRKLCNEELHNLYFSPNVIKTIKSVE
jgi:hypothetical protein